MDTLQPKLYRISIRKYYCSNCSTLFEVDDLPSFRSRYECPSAGTTPT